ncbi:hypothetical protein OIU76_019350 [Salix suchowensis]|nr:hypothetical protein OIU76_019350 [Salix suchowensis]
MPPPLMEIQSSQRYYRAVTIGEDAVISAYRLSEDRSRSLVGAILSKVVPAAFSTISSVSKMIWRSERTPTKKPEVKPQSFAKASPLTCLKDHPRKGEKLTLSPSGTLAAITDSLGRILLLDTQALVVVRLWKGYRDANSIHAPRKGIIEVKHALHLKFSWSVIVGVMQLMEWTIALFSCICLADENWTTAADNSMC